MCKTKYLIYFHTSTTASVLFLFLFYETDKHNLSSPIVALLLLAHSISIQNTIFFWLTLLVCFLSRDPKVKEKKKRRNFFRFQCCEIQNQKKKMVSAIKAAIGDLVLTFLWVFFSSMLGLATNTITTALDLHHVSYNGFDYPSAVIITSLIFILVTIFTFVGNALGGASFNPTANASSYAAGLGSDSLFSMALRFPAQVRPFVMFEGFKFRSLPPSLLETETLVSVSRLFGSHLRPRWLHLSAFFLLSRFGSCVQGFKLRSLSWFLSMALRKKVLKNGPPL